MRRRTLTAWRCGVSALMGAFAIVAVWGAMPSPAGATGAAGCLANGVTAAATSDPGAVATVSGGPETVNNLADLACPDGQWRKTVVDGKP